MTNLEQSVRMDRIRRDGKRMRELATAWMELWAVIFGGLAVWVVLCLHGVL